MAKIVEHYSNDGQPNTYYTSVTLFKNDWDLIQKNDLIQDDTPIKSVNIFI